MVFSFRAIFAAGTGELCSPAICTCMPSKDSPYTPEQNGMIERFFKTLKEECVWLHRFRDRDHAFAEIAAWLDRYHAERPHSALGYLTPNEYREQLAA